MGALVDRGPITELPVGVVTPALQATGSRQSTGVVAPRRDRHHTARKPRNIHRRGLLCNGPIAELGIELDARGNIKINAASTTSIPGIFAAGDASRGQSLVVWAIADGRRAAAAVNEYLHKRH